MQRCQASKLWPVTTALSDVTDISPRHEASQKCGNVFSHIRPVGIVVEERGPIEVNNLMAVGLAVRKAATMNEMETTDTEPQSPEPQSLTHLDMQFIQLKHSTNINSSGEAARYLRQQMYSKGSAKLG